ncbi:MAG TPA: hypothetical protein VKZ64_02335 [Arenimonas sp.]|jgi:hypothetical protein|nr:hypothetical protein [Arenimonas sp.]
MNAQQDPHHTETRRRGIRRTAWAVGLVALGVYAAFILSAVLP